MARILKRSQKGKESAVPIENEYKSFLELKAHLMMLKNGLPYFEESIHSVMEILNIKRNLLSEHKDDVYRLGSTYQTSPFELVDTVPIKKALDADQMELHSLKKEIRECSIKLDKYRYQWQTVIVCVQHPIEYDADKERLTLPDGRVINNMLSREQAVKHYEDYIYNEVNQNQEVKEMTEMLYGDELEKDDLEECL